MRIAIRADGGSLIGMGHIMRTLVLAKEFANNNEVFYVCKTDCSNSDNYKSGIDRIRANGFKIELIREDSVLNNIQMIDADWLITDSYDVDEGYFNETKKIFKKTAYIDDLNSHYFNVDMLINQNINAEDLIYKTNEDTKLLLGPKYAMLREEFRNIQPKVINPVAKDIMLTVGGSDANNVTEKILNYIYDMNYNFHVVIGPSFTNIDTLIQYEKKIRNIKLYFNANMYDLMQKCDIAISACGSTLYELCACGVPFIGVITAENQYNIASKMKQLDIASSITWYYDIIRENLRNSLIELSSNYLARKAVSELQQGYIDGQGVKRIMNFISSF